MDLVTPIPNSVEQQQSGNNSHSVLLNPSTNNDLSSTHLNSNAFGFGSTTNPGFLHSTQAVDYYAPFFVDSAPPAAVYDPNCFGIQSAFSKFIRLIYCLTFEYVNV